MRSRAAAAPEQEGSTRTRSPASPSGPGLAPPRPAAVVGGPSRTPRGARCACGGGCPRCGGVALSVPGDAVEQDADRVAETALRDGPPEAAWREGWREEGGPVPPRLRAGLEPLVGGPLGEARVLAGPGAARSAAAVGARAYALGSAVVVGEGRFRPDTPEGRRLLAHELAHVARQGREGRPALQREADVVEMPPLRVRSGLGDVESTVPGLEALTGVEGASDGAPGTVAYDEDTGAGQASPAARRLPFEYGSWDAGEILSNLAQRDTLEGTDSDAVRCVQAVALALASRVVDGPDAVVGYMNAMGLEGLLSRPPGSRQRAALDVLEHVKTRIQDEEATYGDLLWAMEALHDLFYADTEGTPDEDVLDQLDPTFELGRDVEAMDEWFDSPDEVMEKVGDLAPGEQYLVVAHQVIFNVAFDELESRGIEVATGRSIVVEVDGRNHRIRRIPTDTRPDPSVIDPLVRDRRLGHQLLVFRDGATGELRLYEPEVTAPESHLEDLEPDGSNFERYFRDHPEYSIYHYIQITGKLTPDALAASSAEWTAP